MIETDSSRHSADSGCCPTEHLRVGIDIDKAAAELLAFVDADMPSRKACQFADAAVIQCINMLVDMGQTHKPETVASKGVRNG
ncbi:MAG: hypothetical protein ACK4VV_12535 [Pseudomonas sp.]